MRRAAAVTAALLLLVLTGCSKAHDFVPGPNPPPGRSDVDVDTPDLRALKKDAGIEPCRPGPGKGELPAITLPCLGGGASVDLASLRGPMLINVFQSACDECRVEMPVLQQFHEQYADRVPIIGLDLLDTFPGSALQLAQEGGVTYALLADPNGDVQGAKGFPRVPGYPLTIFLDAKGGVTYAHPGAITSLDDLRQLVDDHLGVSL